MSLKLYEDLPPLDGPAERELETILLQQLQQGEPIQIGTLVIPTGIILETIGQAIRAKVYLVEDIKEMVLGEVERAMSDYNPSMSLIRWNAGKNRRELINFVAAEVVRQRMRDKFIRYIAKIVLVRLSVDTSLSREVREIFESGLETRSLMMKILFFAIEKEVRRFLTENKAH